MRTLVFASLALLHAANGQPASYQFFRGRTPDPHRIPLPAFQCTQEQVNAQVNQLETRTKPNWWTVFECPRELEIQVLRAMRPTLRDRPQVIDVGCNMG